MKNNFKLGDKVSYNIISQKVKINYPPDSYDKEITHNRRVPFKLDKRRFGIVAGRRKLTFETTFEILINENSYLYIDTLNQDFQFAYLIAYDLGKTNFVLAKDLKEENK